MFGVGGDTVEEEEPELEIDEDEGDGSDEGLDPVERLAQGQAAAGLAQAAGEGGGSVGSGDIGEKIQEKANSLNHYLVVEFLPELFAFDAGCMFITTIFTMPIYFFIIVVYLGYQLYNGFTGNKSMIPYCPELTWESFSPAGTGEISIPLPRMVLYIATLWAILLLCIASTVWAGLVMMAVYAMVDPLAALDAATQIFSFFIDLPAI